MRGKKKREISNYRSRPSVPVLGKTPARRPPFGAQKTLAGISLLLYLLFSPLPAKRRLENLHRLRLRLPTPALFSDFRSRMDSNVPEIRDFIFPKTVSFRWFCNENDVVLPQTHFLPNNYPTNIFMNF